MFTLSASGEIAGPFNSSRDVRVALSIITSNMTTVIERSLDGTNWAELETLTAVNTSKNVEGPGQFRVLATSAGTATVQILRV